MPDLIEATAVELARVFAPLGVALESEQEFALFLRRFGISFSPESLSGTVTTLVPLRSGVRAISAAARDAADNGFRLSDIPPLFEAARALFGSVNGLSGNLSGLVPDTIMPWSRNRSR